MTRCISPSLEQWQLERRPDGPPGIHVYLVKSGFGSTQLFVKEISVLVNRSGFDAIPSHLDVTIVLLFFLLVNSCLIRGATDLSFTSARRFAIRTVTLRLHAEFDPGKDTGAK